MPRRYQTIWPLLPHTAAKHSIFRRHLSAWFPKLAWAGHLQVIDGFAGPGEYARGEAGSPVIALEVATTHRANLAQCQIDFLFIEEDLRRFRHLEQKIGELVVPRNIHVQKERGSFRNVLNRLLDEADSQGGVIPPSFVMIDPFGFEGVPMTLVQRIAKYTRTEILVSFMYDSVTRWLDDRRNAGNFDELFGCPDWRYALNIHGAGDRRDFLLDLYVRQVANHGWQYTRTFEMRDGENRTEYFLVFATNNLEGLKVMKRAMWSVDPTGQFQFSDATRRDQLTLFTLEPNFAQFEEEIRHRFPIGAAFTIDELELFAWEETAFLARHIRKPVLIPAEKAGKLEVLSNRKIKNTYPPGTVMRFIS